MISPEMLQKYKAIYKKRFGKDLSDQEALGQAIKLFTLVKAIYKPMTQDDYEMLQERRRITGDMA